MISETITPYHNGRELPVFTLRQIDLPEIVKWQVNGLYYVVLKVEMTGVRNRFDLPAKEDQARLEADFKIVSIRPIGDTPLDTKSIEKKEFEDLVVSIKSGEK